MGGKCELMTEKRRAVIRSNTLSLEKNCQKLIFSIVKDKQEGQLLKKCRTYGSIIYFSENDKSLELTPSEDAVSDLENSPKFVESEDLDALPKRQFKTAEIADAVMGTEVPIDPSDIESLFPKNVKDFQSGFSPPCDENSGLCGSPALTAKGVLMNERTSETSQQVND